MTAQDPSFRAEVDLPPKDLLAVVLATVIGALPAFLVGTLAIEMRRSLHFGTTALGVAVALFFLGAASASVPIGRLVERVGGARVLRVSMLLAAVALGLLGGATTSWGVLVIFLVLSGMISAAMNPAANLFLARRSAVGRQGLVFGIKQAAVPLASLLGGLAVPAVALTLGWRWAFGFGAVLALLTAALLPAPRTTLAERRRQYATRPSTSVVSAPLLALAIGLGLGVLASSGCVAFLVSSAASLGFGTGTGGLLAAGAAAAAVAVRVAIGARADRRSGGELRTVAVLLAIGVGGYAVLGAGTLDHNRGLFVVGALVALGAGWGYNGLFSLAVVQSHRSSPAAATGVTAVGGRVGGMVGPAILGVVADHASYAAAWFVAGGAAIGAAGAMVLAGHLLAERTRSAPEERSAAWSGVPEPGSREGSH